MKLSEVAGIKLKKSLDRYGDFCVGKISNRDDKYFLVDTDVANKVEKYKWCMDKDGYPCANTGNRVLRLHLFVTEEQSHEKVPKGMYVDHINQNKLDNRSCNLRIISPQDSVKNMPIREDNKTGACGVSLDKRTGKYRAYITLNHKQKSLGQYKTIEEATRARSVAEEMYGFTQRQNIKQMLGAQARPTNDCTRCAEYLHGVPTDACFDCDIMKATMSKKNELN